jgi:hypothetical protein
MLNVEFFWHSHFSHVKDNEGYRYYAQNVCEQVSLDSLSQFLACSHLADNSCLLEIIFFITFWLKMWNLVILACPV